MAGRAGRTDRSVPGKVERWARLDAFRGAAVIWMVIFHAAFDLNHFNFLIPRQDFYGDPFWTLQRTMIVSVFIFCAGVSQAVAIDMDVGWPRFWRRWAQVVVCAALVSAGSWWMFPNSWISFGVLHGLAVMMVVARWMGGWHSTLWILGALCLLAPAVWTHVWFDNRWTNWVGLVTRKPVTEDYVPLLPWMGVMLWGLAAGQSLLARRRSWLQAAIPGALKPVSFLGRNSLTVYMLHQPVLMGMLMVVVTLLK